MKDTELNTKIDNFISRIENEHWKIHGFEVYKNGELVKSYGNTTDRFPIYSITKSLLSFAVGIAENEGLIKLNESVCKYLPEEYLNSLTEEKYNAFDQLTIERLLTMSVKGFPFRPAGDNWLKFILDLQFKPEKIEFHYTNICAYLVSVALTEALGKSVYDYLNEKLFAPMNIKNPPYQLSPEGYFMGASGIELSVQELSRIGYMTMSEGVYNNIQLVPKSYIKKACSVQISNKEDGYGYFIWKFLNGFSLNGKWGQKCFCFPDKNLMVTVLSDLQEGSEELKAEVKKWVLENF